MASMEYETENGRYEEDEQRYDRDRSASPRKRDDGYRGGRDRSASPGRNDRGPPPESQTEDDAAASNSGSNLFVTGLPQSLSETEVARMFEKYGEVESCSIMKDPHTHESRGFGFVKMANTDQAEAAKEGLQGENIGGRTLSIEKARRNKPRTPTPGRYFGPPKRDPYRRDDRRGGGSYRGYRDGFGRDGDDRRGGGGGYGRRDDYYRRDIDRYASDRFDRRDDRRERGGGASGAASGATGGNGGSGTGGGEERRGYDEYRREPRYERYDRDRAGGGDRDRDRGERYERR